MGVYIIIYLALCVISVVCAVQGAKRNNNDLFKAFVILSLAAGFVFALGLYHPSGSSGNSVLYVSGSGGTGGMNLWSLIKVCLFAMPPLILGAAASGSSKKR